MKLTKTHKPARTIYRIDRTLNSGEVHKWFYSTIFDTEAKAQTFIDERGPSYRGKLNIIAVDEPEGVSYVGKINF